MTSHNSSSAAGKNSSVHAIVPFQIFKTIAPNFAILLLMARLGLRAGKIVALVHFYFVGLFVSRMI
jgi:hypothetical protein